MFHHAIVCKPSSNFAQGLTSKNLGKPDYCLTIEQHRKYCNILERCGLTLSELDADIHFPDSTFIEDTAVLTKHFAVITNPGAESRKGETLRIRKALKIFYKRFYEISAPGTLDGGDICEAEGHFFMGISQRTNEAGAQQLADILEKEGFSSTLVDVRQVPGILHLKSGITYLGNGYMVLIDALASLDIFKPYHIIQVKPEENEAANCLRVNDYVIIPLGYPNLQSSIEQAGFNGISLDMSEFQKMDGGLSCLSLRF